MSIINAGMNFGGIDRGRGFVAKTNETGRAIQETGLLKPPPVELTHGTRLVYDHDMKRSYVEFLDEESGRVIDRFPAEQLHDGIMAREIGHALASSILLDVLV